MAASAVIQVPLSRGTPDNDLQAIAVHRLERWWMSIRDRRIFKTLKFAICSSEHSLTHEILRKLNPREAHLLNDPSMHVKIKFRLDGTSFPPHIVFKIYTQSTSIKYINGRNTIHPMSEALEDARQQMGNRMFYDQLLSDYCYDHPSITDVTTIKEYMKYTSSLDDTPALYGGKENYWRKLTLNVMSRFGPTHAISDILRVSLDEYSSPSSHRSSRASNTTMTTASVNRRFQLSPTSTSERQSVIALKRVKKMKKNFLNETQTHTTPPGLDPKPDDVDNEAMELYQWTRDLSFEDLN